MRVGILVAAITAAFMPVNSKAGTCDGYWIEQSSFTNIDLRVKVIFYNSFRELKEAAKKTRGFPTNYEHLDTLQEFVQVNPDGRCIIHAVDQTKVYDPCFMGHGLLHCVYGDFHQNRRK